MDSDELQVEYNVACAQVGELTYSIQRAIKQRKELFKKLKGLQAKAARIEKAKVDEQARLQKLAEAKAKAEAAMEAQQLPLAL